MGRLCAMDRQPTWQCDDGKYPGFVGMERQYKSFEVEWTHSIGSQGGWRRFLRFPYTRRSRIANEFAYGEACKERGAKITVVDATLPAERSFAGEIGATPALISDAGPVHLTWNLATQMYSSFEVLWDGHVRLYPNVDEPDTWTDPFNTWPEAGAMLQNAVARPRDRVLHV